MKIRFVLTLFIGLFVTPIMASPPKYICPKLPQNSGVTWHQKHGIDTHHCTAIRTKDGKDLFYVNLGSFYWQGSDAKNAHQFKGVIAGHSILWQFNSRPSKDDPQWESMFSIPLKQQSSTLWILVSLPRSNRDDTREALGLLAKMKLVLPYNGP
jgi:hypothetical protein